MFIMDFSLSDWLFFCNFFSLFKSEVILGCSVIVLSSLDQKSLMLMWIGERSCKCQTLQYKPGRKRKVKEKPD